MNKRKMGIFVACAVYFFGVGCCSAVAAEYVMKFAHDHMMN